MGEPMGQGPVQEDQNGRTIASATHQGAGAGFPKLIHRQHPLQHPLFGEKWRERDGREKCIWRTNVQNEHHL